MVNGRKPRRVHPFVRRALASLIPIASFGLLAARLTGGGESPPEARRPPALRYLLRVRSSDLSGFDVRLRIRGAPAAFDLAMFAHPEYDARFWRYLEGLEASSPGGPGRIVREENALWRVTGCSGDCSVRYRIRLPPETGPARAAYRPFLAETGGLVGGPDAFLYLVGAEKAPARLRLGLPPGWDAATGLDRGGRPNEFTAASAEALLDSPILIGRCRTWRFSAGGVPHIVAYWPLPDAAAFDAGAFVDGVARVAREAIRIFGGAPYRHYTFLYQDGAFGALEHADSVTIGAPSHELARNPRWHLPVTAHEFFHTWNLVRTRPVERVGIGYRPPEPTRELWWSEGVTMYYADLLMLRAGLPAPDGATRTEHLENLLARYLVNAGNARISPERASAALGGPPGAFGDETADVYLQGRLIGAALDLVLRDATDGRRSLDDVLRAMNRRFFGARGFGGRDLQRTAEEVCGCDLEAFFDRFVRGGNALDSTGRLRSSACGRVSGGARRSGRTGKPRRTCASSRGFPRGRGTCGSPSPLRRVSGDGRDFTRATGSSASTAFTRGAWRSFARSSIGSAREMRWTSKSSATRASSAPSCPCPSWNARTSGSRRFRKRRSDSVGCVRPGWKAVSAPSPDLLAPCVSNTWLVNYLGAASRRGVERRGRRSSTSPGW